MYLQAEQIFGQRIAGISCKCDLALVMENCDIKSFHLKMCVFSSLYKLQLQVTGDVLGLRKRGV